MNNYQLINSIDRGIIQNLEIYVSVHNELLDSSILRIIPLPFLRKKFNFTNYSMLLRDADIAILEYKDELYGFLPSDSLLEHEYIICLMEYVLLLDNTIQLLSKLIDKLKQKSNGDIIYKYSEYRNDLRVYEKSTEKYQEYGKLVNELQLAFLIDSI